MKSDTRIRYDYETDNNSHSITFDAGVIRLYVNVGPSHADMKEVVFTSHEGSNVAWTSLKELSQFLADVVATHEKVRRKEVQDRLAAASPKAMTTSRKRRKAREWMQSSIPKKEHERELVVAKSNAYHEGSRAMERDMTELQARVYEKYLEEGRVQCTRATVSFPDGHKDPRPRRIKVAMPFAPSRFGGFAGYVPQSVKFVEFMPILCSVTQQFDDQRCSLEWVQWAPNIAGGGEENELNGLKYTRAMTMARGKINHAAMLLRDVCQRRFFMRDTDDSTISKTLGEAMPDIMKAGQMAEDAAEELRLELGKFAPDEGPGRWLRSGMDQWPPLRSPW